MFQLLVAGNNSSGWETDQLMRFDARRFGEYSSSEARNLSLADSEHLKTLTRYPALLMYEIGNPGPAGKVVRFGYLRDIKLSGIEVTFRFDNHGHFPRDMIEQFAERLGIKEFEHSRNHWAVKDGDLPTALVEQITPSPYGIQINEVRPNSYHGDMGFMDFLKRIWNLASMPSTDPRFENAESDIWQHAINNADWDQSYLLLDYLGLSKCSDKNFLKFVETAVHPLIGDAHEVSFRLNELNQLLATDGFRLAKTSEMSSRPIYKAQPIITQSDEPRFSFEVVLSFAGEDRGYVEQVAAFLKEEGVDVFYDRYEEATLWGKDLAEHLDFVYRSDARYCVMFLSQHYADKIWTNHERRAALARAVQDRQEYILPARFDSTEIPGIRPTIGYVDLSQKTAQKLGELILQKLGRSGTGSS
jgi:hypothetical protein